MPVIGKVHRLGLSNPRGRGARRPVPRRARLSARPRPAARGARWMMTWTRMTILT